MKIIKVPEQLQEKRWRNAWLYDIEQEKKYNGKKYHHLIVSCNICQTSPEYQIFTYPADEDGNQIALGDTPIRVWSLIPETHKEEPKPFDEKWVKRQREKIINEFLSNS